MVDRIKRAFESLEAPICSTCDIEMRWTRSALVDQSTINHLFYCPNCHRTGETTSKIGSLFVPRDKLSAPVEQAA
jgi:hypothetical protein